VIAVPKRPWPSFLTWRARLRNRVQITTDGHKPYLEAIEGAFGGDVDYAMLVKIYGEAPEGRASLQPSVCLAAVRQRIEGNPDMRQREHKLCERQKSHDENEAFGALPA